MTLLFAALLVHGFIPGPRLISDTPQVLYAAGAGLFATTAMLAIIGWPLCRTLYKVVTLDRTLILVGSLALCMLGVWSINSSTLM